MKKEIKKTGRKKIVFTEQDFEKLQKLCEIQCTRDEICHVFNIDDETLNRILLEEYGVYFKEFKNRFQNFGRVSLRRKQFELAKKNAAMAIFLGKQYLNQKDERSDVHNLPAISIVLPNKEQ